MLLPVYIIDDNDFQMNKNLKDGFRSVEGSAYSTV